MQRLSVTKKKKQNNQTQKACLASKLANLNTNKLTQDGFHNKQRKKD